MAYIYRPGELGEGYANASLSRDALDPCFHFEIKKVLATVCTVWAQNCKDQDIKITTTIDPLLPQVIFQDTLTLQYCVNNLISNAMARTQTCVKMTAQLFITKKSNPYMALSIIDDGPALSIERRASLISTQFDLRRRRVRKIGEIDTSYEKAKHMIENLGGHLLTNTSSLQGNCFSLVIPIAPRQIDKSAPSKPKAPQSHVFSLSDVNLLVVDDYNLNQLTVKTLLQDHVAKIHIASNGFEALEVLNSCQVHVVLMDIHMPGLDGIETTIRIRETKAPWANVFIIALTADPQYQHVNLIKKIGMNDALSKPIRRTDLLRALTHLPNHQYQHVSA